MRKFVIATHNAHKLEEFQRILKPLGIQAVSQSEAGVHVDVEETKDTFEGNSLLKARAVFQACGLPTLADDSGLAVDALDGAPGVFSARYGGAGLTDTERYQKLLHEMREVPEEARTARFVCCISLILSNTQEYTFTGVCDGKIAREPSGVGGFGYDPVFLVGDTSFSDLSPMEKDVVSHRGKALRMLSEHLKSI